MSLGEFLRKQLMYYFIIVTIVTLVTGILGLIYEPNQRFGYDSYFSPLIFGLIGVLPGFVTYSKKELTLKQSIVRGILQLLLIEVMVISFGYIMGILKIEIIGSMIFSIFAIFIGVNCIDWLISNKNAKSLTLYLKAYQDEITKQ